MTDKAVTALLTQRLAKERLAFGPNAGQPGFLIADLVQARPSLAPPLRDLAVSGEVPALTPLLPVILAAHAELHPDDAATQARELLAFQDTAVTRAVAQSLGWNRGHRPLAAGERELLLEFATHADLTVRQAPAVVAGRIADKDPATACELLAATDFTDSPQLADEVFMCFAKPFGLSWERLTEAQVTAIRSRLVPLADIGEHWITALLTERSAVEPTWVIELLQDRVTYAEQLGQLGGYRPMPLRWDEHQRLRIREHHDFIPHLRQLHAWIAAAPSSWIRQDIGAEIFAEVAQPFDQTVLTVLSQALQSTNQADIHAVAAIIRKAHRTLIWDSPGFVRTALQAAARFGDDCRDQMAGPLRTATISGTRRGEPGKPFSEDIEQLDLSRQIARTMPHRSYEESFYLDMAASADEDIARTLAEDWPGDGREW